MNITRHFEISRIALTKLKMFSVLKQNSLKVNKNPNNLKINSKKYNLFNFKDEPLKKHYLK